MITQDHIEQELSRLERCERFNDPTRRNWPWKEVWQEAIDRHRAFLYGKTEEKHLCEKCKKKYKRSFEPYIEEWRFCLECDRKAAENFITKGTYFIEGSNEAEGNVSVNRIVVEQLKKGFK